MLQQGGQPVCLICSPPRDRRAVIDPSDPDCPRGCGSGAACLRGDYLPGDVLRLTGLQGHHATVEQPSGQRGIGVHLEQLAAGQLRAASARGVTEPAADVIDAEIRYLPVIAPDCVREDEPVQQAVHHTEDPGRPAGEPSRVCEHGKLCSERGDAKRPALLLLRLPR